MEIDIKAPALQAILRCFKFSFVY